MGIRQAPDAAELAYMARQLVQCTLPHSDPGNVPVWTRVNGSLTLAIRPHVDLKTRTAQYPYGSIPRLLLFWFVTEATQKKSRHIKLGTSLDPSCGRSGSTHVPGEGSGDAKRLHSQMERLFQATITLEDARESHVSRANMLVSRQSMLWWDTRRVSQDNLFESWVELSEDFFDAITAAPVPVDYRALRALKRSPLALDLYAWASYTAFSASRKGQTRTVPWEALHAQIGGEYDRLRKFREKALQALRKIHLVYPALSFEDSPVGLKIHPGTPAIPPAT